MNRVRKMLFSLVPVVFIIGLVLISLPLHSSPALAASGRSGGPDSFGYTFLDSNTPDGPTYDWIEISDIGTPVLMDSDDSWVSNINLGFFFNYYGTDYSQLAISNNGLLFFGAGSTQYVNDPITQSPSVHGFVAPYWDDIVTWETAGAVYYQTLGTAPNRKFVVEWYDNQHYDSSGSGVTFEAILYEGSNNILFQIYIDPAGYIYDVDTGERIAGASVWLQRPDGLGGWENVPTGQNPSIMQPDVNPLITGANGQYQWDVLEGSYRVHVEAPGYFAADSVVVSIPPPVTDLHVGLAPLLHDLTITSTAGGSVTTPGEGTFIYDRGAVVNLVATSDADYQFDNWTGDVGTIVNVNAATTTITMSGNYSITANFEKVTSHGGGCFIATAAYGTPMAKEVQILREFRDEYLLTNPVGKGLVGFYYRVSPPIAEFITEHPSLKPIVRAGLVPAVAMSTVAINTTPAEKAAIIGLLALVSVAVAIWTKRRRDRDPKHTSLG